MRDGQTYRANKRRKQRHDNNIGSRAFKIERLGRGITRSQMDREYGEVLNDAQRRATAAKASQ